MVSDVAMQFEQMCPLLIRYVGETTTGLLALSRTDQGASDDTFR